MILKNGLIIENNKLVKKDILIKDNLITNIADVIAGDDILDCSDCLVMPGAIDVHVHLREPGYSHKETIKTGTEASAKGGVTTVMAMPNLNPVPDSLNNLAIEEDIIKKDAVVNVYPYGAVTKSQKGQEIADLEDLASRVYAVTDDGVGVNNIDILKEAMQIAKKYNIVIASHAEDLVDSKLPQGEYVAVRREIELAKEIGCKYHFCHLSTKESFEAVRKAKKEGYNNITCEVAPHHLLLNEEMIADANWKMNPPLRSEENRLATIEALLDGTADMVASDHAPHSEEEKALEYDRCPNGIIGIETLVPTIYTEFVRNEKISLERFLDLLVYNPIKVFNLPERKLAIGYVADIAVLDINTLHTYKRDEIKSIGKNSPLIGKAYYGFPKYTLVGGKLVYKQ